MIFFNSAETVFESKNPLDIDHTIKGIAKILYQYIINLSELKVELLKVITGEEDSCFDRDNGECNDGEYYS